MKDSILLLLLLGAYAQCLSAQHNPNPKHKIKYRVSIQMKGNSRQIGSIYSTTDTSLVLAKTSKWFLYGVTRTEAIPVENILKVQAKRTNGGRRGVFIGMGVGAVIGAVIGYSSYKKPPPSQGLFDFNLDFGPGLDAVGGALIGLPSGALLGGIIRANIKKTFLINGNQNTYIAQREKLKRLSITGQ